jgi:arginyl-tRNA synthetase
MQLAKPAKRNPRELAQAIVDALMGDPNATAVIAQAELAGPGFINFRLTHAARSAVLPLIAQLGEAYGRAPRKEQKVLVEFVSANPTGPLHVGHARQAALGDALCRLFDASGFNVSREFYYNDAGNQIQNLAISVQARAQGVSTDAPNYPADGYKGEYIADIAKEFVAKASANASDGEPVIANGKLDDLDNIRRFAVTYLRHEQDLDLQAFGLAFDRYYLESSLYTSGRVENTVNQLVASGHTYESENG